MRRDPRVTAFIDGRAPFARPILRHLRKVIHACGGAVLEDANKGELWEPPPGR